MKKQLLLNFINVLLFIVAHHPGIAQRNDPLKINSIPYSLIWENTPLKYTIKNDVLTIVAGPKTDMFRDPNVTYNTDNAPKLLFTSDDDFVLSTSIQHSFLNKWDGGAIVIIQDSLNWIKFCFEKDYTGAKRVVSVVTKDISDDCNSVEIKGSKVFYKAAKAGNVITLYCSEDNKKWVLIRHFQFNNTKPLKIGFLAQSPTGKQCEVRFSGIRYKAKKIKDPYLGE
jgi:regulation of enolase protein 1 (concanavalin A-like superfamily)